MTIDYIIAALLLSSWLLFVAGRAGVRRTKRTGRWCWKHGREYRWYMDGSRDCPLCLNERIADIHRQGANLREDI